MDEGLASPAFGLAAGEPITRNNALANKIAGVLSTSFANADIRDAIEVLDQQDFHSTPETRRQFKLNIQKEVIDCNGEVIIAFGEVAEVGHDLVLWEVKVLI